MKTWIRGTGRFVLSSGIVLALLAMLIPGALLSVEAQANRSAYWKEYNTEITVHEDGTFHVVETQVVSFSGEFSFGNRVIPADRVEAMENFQVHVANSQGEEPREFEQMSQDNGEPGTYVLNERIDETEIVYNFDPTSGTEDRVIVIEFDVIGGLRVYPDEDPANQQLWWVGVPADVTGSADVESATITYHLPEVVDTEETVWQPDDGETQDGQTWVWERTNLESGSEFDARLQFPPITSATVPSWQEADDRERALQEEQEDKNAVAGTIYLGFGLLIGVGGAILVILRWYTTGRDPEIGLVAETMSEPPDDLHPGAAGTLIDERTDTRDVVATLVDLGRRHIIHISDGRKEGGFAGFGGNTVYDIELLDLKQPMQDYERQLLDTIFPGRLEVGKVTPMHKAQERMVKNASKIHGGFYKEVVEHGYFEKRPDKVRARYSLMGIFAPIIAVIVWFFVAQVYGGESGWVWFMAFAAAFVFFLGLTVSQAMVRKTLKGAEAAAKWKAFKRYLEDIEKRVDLKESQEIFERYLPYAVAFGIESSWVTKFERAGANTPDWFGGGPVFIPTGGGAFGHGHHHGHGHGRRRSGGWVFGTGPTPRGGSREGDGGDGGGLSFPDLQGSSDAAGRGLTGASGSLLGMLGTAAKVLSNSSGSSGGFGGGGGGFSGGGGFGGGGGGGGSSSFG